MSSTLQASVFMGKNYLENLHSIKNTGKDLTKKQMFDISEKLIAEQSDEIYGVNTINWDDSAWKHLSLIGGEEVISLSHTKVYVFSDSVLCLGKMNETPQSNTVWEDKLRWFKSSSQYRALDRIDGEPMEFEWNIFPGFTPLQLCYKVPEFLSKKDHRTRSFHRTDYLHVDVQRHHGDLKKINRNPNQALNSFRFMQKDLHQEDGHSSGPGSEKKWYSTHESKPQGEWDRVPALMMIKFGESGHPVFRATIPLSRGTVKSTGGGQLSVHFCADEGTIKTVFRTIISVNQLSIHGAVSDLCEEYRACQARKRRLVLAGQSDTLFEPASLLMNTPTPSIENPAQEEDLLQKYQERVEMLSQQNRVIKFCTDAGYLTTVDVGQYFMTKDTEHFSQFTESVACREYTLPKDEKSTDPKGWIRGNTKNGPVLEVTTSYLQGKIWSGNWN